MNVGSIYRASHIIGMLPPQGGQEAAEVRGGRDKDGDRDDAMGAIQSVPTASVNMKGQPLGQLLSVSA